MGRWSYRGTFPPPWIALNRLLIRVHQFHFANILSPWIRRSLVAAGFGTRSSAHSGMRHEIAPVTRYHDEYIADPQHLDEDDSKRNVQVGASCPHDPEAAISQPTAPSSSRSSTDSTAASHTDGSKYTAKAPVVATTTPLFHFDVAAAVRVAETGIVARRRSYNTFPEKA